MEKFLEAATVAWNPIGEVRRRMGSGTLNLGSVLAPFVGIVIVCNICAIGAQKFFMQSLLYAAGGNLPNHPLITSEYAQSILSAIGVLVPAAAVAILPTWVFNPISRSTTVAALLVVAAALAFYSAAIGVPLYFVAGALATVNLELGLRAYVLLTIPMIIGIIGLTLFFWFRVTLGVLKLTGTQVIGISLVALIAEALLYGFVLFLTAAS